jgi:Pentapeptide repeats (8 copies)
VPNPEHLDLLQRGVHVWNAWRLKDLSLSPDLSGADLAGANLTETNLNRANLVGANLREANLHGVHLESASLDRADLAGANLVGARRTRSGHDGRWVESTRSPRIGRMAVVARRRPDWRLGRQSGRTLRRPGRAAALLSILDHPFVLRRALVRNDWLSFRKEALVSLSDVAR